jgi:hypothetical protein
MHRGTHYYNGSIFVTSDDVIEANVINIIEDNKCDTSEESNKAEEDNGCSFDSVFRSLPSTGTNSSDNNVCNNIDSNVNLGKCSVRNTTQVFHMPVGERRYKDVANSFGNETNKVSFYLFIDEKI